MTGTGAHPGLRTRTKVCGITNEDDRDLAVAAGADALGFIVAVSNDSPREISAARADELIAGVPPLTTSVLVTMPESVDETAQLCAQTGADAVQVHADLSPEALAALGERADRPVIAAVDATDQIVAPATAADAVLVDSAGDNGAGGTGRTHDWSRTADLTAELDVPVVLAGGLTADNVAAAVETVRPFAVDAASGLEHAGGLKDPDAVRAFVAAATREAPA
jgi:phosphoribosylanthranilate isomerase